MTTRAKLTLCAALATALVCLSLTPLLETSDWVLHAYLVIAVTAGAGAGLRALPVPRVLVTPLQLLVVVYMVMLGFVQPSMADGVLPGPKALDALGTLLAGGGSDIREYSIPAPASDGLRLIIVGSVALIAVLVDALAVTYRRAAVAGLPLLALYSVGTGLAGAAGTSWLWFLLGAAGFLLLLHTEGQDRLSRWGRVFHGANRSGTGALSYGGYRVGVIALAMALLLPAFVPHVGAGLLSGFKGSSSGSGQGNGGGLSSLSPLVALTAGVRSDSNQEMFRYTTDSPDAESMYLRIAALDTFDGVQWTFGPQNLVSVPVPLPTAPGLSPEIPKADVSTRVAVSDQMSSDWLPLPYPATAVTAPGRWRFDPVTMAVTGEAGQHTNGVQYQVSSADLKPTREELKDAGPADKALIARYTALPSNLPAVVKQTAEQVTAGRNNPYDQAVALQNWFAKGPFTYSTKVDPGTGTDAITKFLQDKTGFCVHFAATMAAMARTLGIPSRVAIGFIPGENTGPGQYLVRARAYHAWPELYFQGTGWVRFEPTPTSGTSIPEYAKDAPAPTASATTQQPTAAPSDSASAAPTNSSNCTAAQRRLGDCNIHHTAADSGSLQPAWWDHPAVLAGLALGGLVVVLLISPMLWRTRLRRRRLGAGRHLPGAGPAELTETQVLAAWQELIDSAWDLGIPPDDAQTPRHTVRRLAEAAELDAEATAAAGRVALATEQVLYAREVHPAGPLGADVRAARHGLLAHADRTARIRAVLLPASGARLWWRAADRIAALREGLRQRTARATGAVTGAVRRTFRREDRS